MSKLKKNLGYQTVYQLLNTCIPLITSPYLARKLGAEKQGVFSFTLSNVNYFTLLAMLGIVNYGTRTIASCLGDKKRISYEFWSLYSMQLIASIISAIAYGIYLLFICSDNIIIATIQGCYLIGAIVDINWLFFGIEKFKTTVTRSIFIRISTVVLILLFVNDSNDLWVYTLIMAGGTLLSNTILWRFLPQEVDLSQVREIRAKDIKKHIKPNIVLFIPLLAMSVFHIMDKTMLGLLSTYEQVGYYYNADKIINIPIGILTGVGTVMLPRMTALLDDNKMEEASSLFSISVECIVALSSALAFGIACVSKEFTPFFFGKGFEPCVILIIVLSPVLIIKGLSQTSRMQFLIPSHNEKIFIQSVFLGAFVNLILNIPLINRFGALGAVIGTLAAELTTCTWQYIKMNAFINSLSTILKSSIYIVFGIIMFVSVRFSSSLLPGNIIGLMIEIAIGATVYLVLCVIYWKATNNTILSTFIKKK